MSAKSLLPLMSILVAWFPKKSPVVSSSVCVPPNWFCVIPISNPPVPAFNAISPVADVVPIASGPQRIVVPVNPMALELPCKTCSKSKPSIWS